MQKLWLGGDRGWLGESLLLDYGGHICLSLTIFCLVLAIIYIYPLICGRFPHVFIHNAFCRYVLSKD